jgi:hypothetical protein
MRSSEAAGSLIQAIFQRMVCDLITLCTAGIQAGFSGSVNDF